jgi:uncharacterized glyoxalase superfamily protein PhnB
VELETSYTVVATEKLAECRDFYKRCFGFEVAFEATWFVYLTASRDSPHGIAFMLPEHPSRPPGPEPFSGDGILLTLQVEDAAAEAQRLAQLGVEVDHPLTDEPWGQRRLGIRDPAGVWVDIVEQIEPAPGFWDQYLG